MKKILLILGLILLNLSLVFATSPMIVSLVAQDMGNTVRLDVTAYRFNGPGIDWIKIYENGNLIPENLYTCNGINPLVCSVEKDYPNVGSATYYAKAKDGVGSKTSNEVTINLAPTISNVQVVNILPTEVTITWDTDEKADSKIRYGITSGSYTDEEYDNILVKSHSLTLTGLSEGATYYFDVKSVDSDGKSDVSSEGSFTTTDITAPVINNIQIVDINPTEVTITWDTNENSDSLVRYGISSGAYTLQETDASLVIDHSIILTGLTEGVTYYFNVESTDASTNTITSAEQTLVPSDVTGPAINNVDANVDVTVIPIIVTITWNTDEDSDSRVRYGTTTGTYGFNQYDPLIGLSHSIDLIGLGDDTTYYYVIESVDVDGNIGISVENNFTIPDITSPVISNIQVVDLTLTSTRIVWQTDEDSTSEVRYGTTTGVYGFSVNGSDYVTNHDLFLDDLADGETYYYVVENVDEDNNVATSVERSFTVGRLIITFVEPDDGDEFYVGKTIEGEIKIENNDINDMDVDVKIVLYDETDDDEIEEKEFDRDIDSGDNERFEFEFDLPLNLDEGNDYQLYAEVSADGANYKQIIDLDLDRKKNDVKIEDIRLYPSSSNIEVIVGVENLGKKTQEDVYVELVVYGLDASFVSDRFELGSWDDEDNRMSKRFNFEKPEEGVYTFEATVYYGTSSDYVTKDFNVGERSVAQRSDSNVQFVSGNVPSANLASMVDKADFGLLTMKNITWGIVDFLLLAVVMYLISQLIRGL